MPTWRAAKIDEAQRALVPFLRAHGASFQSTAILGKGAPDGMLGYAGSDCWCEFKAEGEEPEPHQIEWHVRWRGAPVAILRTEADCRALLTRMRGRRALK